MLCVFVCWEGGRWGACVRACVRVYGNPHIHKLVAKCALQGDQVSLAFNYYIIVSLTLKLVANCQQVLTIRINGHCLPTFVYRIL